MKKYEKSSYLSHLNGTFCENDTLFDPDENLYNNPDEGECLTFPKVNTRKSKNRKNQNNEKNKE